MGVEIPMYQDCKKCGVKEICRFINVAYSQPCDKCKNTKEYQAEEAIKDKELRGGGITEAFDNQRATGVFEGKGTRFFTNSKGNIVKTEPLR